jgi:hypothetical protein
MNPSTKLKKNSYRGVISTSRLWETMLYTYFPHAAVLREKFTAIEVK